jgi:hypothetical protein
MVAIPGGQMSDIELISWYCPECGARNYDFPDQLTCCGACDHVIWVGNEDNMIFEESEMPKQIEIPLKFLVTRKVTQ